MQQRYLDLETQNKIVAWLSEVNKESNIIVTAAEGDREAFTFATEIKNFLVREKYNNVQGVVSIMNIGPPLAPLRFNKISDDECIIAVESNS